MIASVGIFFGSDTGNTEKVAHLIQDKLGINTADIFDVVKSDKEDVEKYNKLLFGIPTWYYGEMQSDWDDFLPSLQEINFSGKRIAIFGCGDQEDYSEYFCDAMFTLYSTIKSNGGIFSGSWPVSEYYFMSSKSVINNKFIGLAIDEDRQPEKTNNRIKDWVDQINEEWELKK